MDETSSQPSVRPFCPRCRDRGSNRGPLPWEVSEGDRVSDGEPGGLGGPLIFEWLDAGRAGERAG